MRQINFFIVRNVYVLFYTINKFRRIQYVKSGVDYSKLIF